MCRVTNVCPHYTTYCLFYCLQTGGNDGTVASQEEAYQIGELIMGEWSMKTWLVDRSTIILISHALYISYTIRYV